MDYVFCGQEVRVHWKAVDAWHCSKTISDHNAVFVIFERQQGKRKRKKAFAIFRSEYFRLQRIEADIFSPANVYVLCPLSQPNIPNLNINGSAMIQTQKYTFGDCKTYEKDK